MSEPYGLNIWINLYDLPIKKKQKRVFMNKRKVTECMIMKINLKMQIDACIQLFKIRKVCDKDSSKRASPHLMPL